jgi:lysophospholipase L1-like esterase
MKKIIFLAFCIFCISVVVYLWYARASIYWSLGDVPLYAPSDYASYSIGVDTQSGTSLTYAAIGDSVTAGVGVDSYLDSYPYLIASSIASTTKGGVKLVPFAIPGIRSEYVAGYFLEPVIASKPDVVTVLIGINDIHGNVPKKVFRAHYEEILKRLTQETTAEVYAINLPYIGTQDLIALPYQYYFAWRTEEYNAIIKELASKYTLTYIDLNTLHKPQSLDTAYYAEDYFHPNTIGYRQWASYIYASFNK